MRIDISEEVWNEVAKHGKFGETVDTVLRRILKIPESRVQSTHPRPSELRKGGTRVARSKTRERFATIKMSSYVQNGSLVVEFAGGPRRTFPLSSREDKVALRRRRDEAVEFARVSGASYGQEMAVKKALTEAGYHLIK